jgi:hypothetical protein
MDVVRELRRKQDDVKADRQELVDQIAAFDSVIQAYEPNRTQAKKKSRQNGKRGQGSKTKGTLPRWP